MPILNSQTVRNALNDDYYVRKGTNGNSVIPGDLTVNGDIYASTIISIPDISLNPFYIKNPNNLGINPITESAVIIEGGADRTDISDNSASFAIYKPINGGVGSRLASVNMIGVDASGNETQYASIRSFVRSDTNGAQKGQLSLLVATGFQSGGKPFPEVKLQIDGSDNYIRALDGAVFQVDGSGATVYSVPCNYSVQVATGAGIDAFPANGATVAFTPEFTGTYAFELTYIFDTSGAVAPAVINDNNVLGFRVSGAGNDYGACIAGKAITLPTSGSALPYTISSLHQLTAGTAYTITYIYLGSAGAKGGTAGGFVLEANLI
jgi:hypothetical protein